MSWLTDIPYVIRAIPRLEKTMGEIATTLAGVTEQLGKAKGEILDRIGDLETRLAEAGKLDADDRAALDALKSAATAVDDIVLDAEAPAEPTPEPEEPVATEPESGPTDLPPLNG